MKLLQHVWVEDKCQNLASPAIQQSASLIMLAIILVIVVGTVHFIGSNTYALLTKTARAFQ